MAKAKQNRSKTGMRWGEGTVRERLGASGNTAYQARWIDDAGEHARSFPSRDAAEDFLRDQHRAKRDGRYAPPSELTVRQLVGAYIERGAGRWKANTYYAYEQRARLHIIPALGDLKLATLSTPRLQFWLDSLSRQGMQPGLVKAIAIVLKQSLREATALGIIASNPAVGLRLPIDDVKRAVTWTADEVGRFIAELAGEPMWQALYRLALTTGLRPGELRALTWNDIDFDKGVINVRRTVSRDREGHTIIGTTTKTGKDRAVAAPPSAIRALLEWRATQKVRRINGLVFDRGSGIPLDPACWRRWHQKFAERAGVPVITLHEIRHTNATVALEAGTHPLIVSQRLGHASIQTTLDRYTHVSMALQRTSADELDRRLFGEDVLPRHPIDDPKDVIVRDSKLSG